MRYICARIAIFIAILKVALPVAAFCADASRASNEFGEFSYLSHTSISEVIPNNAQSPGTLTSGIVDTVKVFRRSSSTGPAPDPKQNLWDAQRELTKASIPVRKILANDLREVAEGTRPYKSGILREEIPLSSETSYEQRRQFAHKMTAVVRAAIARSIGLAATNHHLEDDDVQTLMEQFNKALRELWRGKNLGLEDGLADIQLADIQLVHKIGESEIEFLLSTKPKDERLDNARKAIRKYGVKLIQKYTNVFRMQHGRNLDIFNARVQTVADITLSNELRLKNHEGMNNSGAEVLTAISGSLRPSDFNKSFGEGMKLPDLLTAANTFEKSKIVVPPTKSTLRGKVAPKKPRSRTKPTSSQSYLAAQNELDEASRPVRLILAADLQAVGKETRPYKSGILRVEVPLSSETSYEQRRQIAHEMTAVVRAAIARSVEAAAMNHHVEDDDVQRLMDKYDIAIKQLWHNKGLGFEDSLADIQLVYSIGENEIEFLLSKKPKDERLDNARKAIREYGAKLMQKYTNEFREQRGRNFDIFSARVQTAADIALSNELRLKNHKGMRNSGAEVLTAVRGSLHPSDFDADFGKGLKLPDLLEAAKNFGVTPPVRSKAKQNYLAALKELDDAIRPVTAMLEDELNAVIRDTEPYRSWILRAQIPLSSGTSLERRRQIAHDLTGIVRAAEARSREVAYVKYGLEDEDMKKLQIQVDDRLSKLWARVDGLGKEDSMADNRLVASLGQERIKLLLHPSKLRPPKDPIEARKAIRDHGANLMREYTKEFKKTRKDLGGFTARVQTAADLALANELRVKTYRGSRIPVAHFLTIVRESPQPSDYDERFGESMKLPELLEAAKKYGEH